MKKLSCDIIENSNTIQNWLKQFDSEDINSAIELLLNLRFVSKEDFLSFISSKIEELYQDVQTPIALYSIRKNDLIKKEVLSLWNADGSLIKRPGKSLGSEDFVYSVINTLHRQQENLLDHPDITELRVKKVKHIVFIDDNIGSGNRVKTFLESFFMNKAIRSWWNYGLIKIHILSYTRNKSSENEILKSIPGKNHNKIKIRKNKKVFFISWYVYDTKQPNYFWGNSSEAIYKFCQKYSGDYKFGYKQIMSNLLFEFSVPNTLPGRLWCDKSKYKPLFPNNIIPNDIHNLLLKNNLANRKYKDKELYILLECVKSGVKSKSSLANRLCYDTNYIEYLLDIAISIGLMDNNKILTKAGNKYLHDNRSLGYNEHTYNSNLYIPNSWCNDRSFVQPFVKLNTLQTELVSQETNGDIGQISLDRTDVNSLEANHKVESSSSHTESIMTSDFKIVNNQNHWCAEEWSLHQLLEEASNKFESEETINKLQEYSYKLKQNNAPVIFSLKHLAYITKVPYKYLRDSIKRKSENNNYKLFKISKRSGGTRWIHAVPSKLFYIHKFINKYIISRQSPSVCSFAFHSSGGIYKNAKMHCGARWLFQFDLKDFFYNINEFKIYKIFRNIGYTPLLSLELTRLCTTIKLPYEKRNYCYNKKNATVYSFYNEISNMHLHDIIGVLPQGASTSPMLSNLAAKELDEMLLTYAMKYNFVYTRYADDITFSAINLPKNKSVREIQRDIIGIIRKCNFIENSKKVRVAGPGAKKIVMGLLVDGKNPRLSKETYKRIERLLYATQKFGLVATAEHEGFDSVYGFYNHIKGLVAFVKDVDSKRYAEFNKTLTNIQNLECKLIHNI